MIRWSGVNFHPEMGFQCLKLAIKMRGAKKKVISPMAGFYLQQKK
jgi:hypothetical protein